MKYLLLLFLTIFISFVIVVVTGYVLSTLFWFANQSDTTMSVFGYTFTFLCSLVATYSVINLWAYFFRKVIK
jgi:hypothetical protein